MANETLAIQVFKPRVLKLLGHERRYAIFWRLGERPWTCKELAEDLDEDIKRVYEDVEALAGEGAVELVGKEAGPHGGPHICRYRASRYTFDAADWDAMPQLQKETISISISRLLVRELKDALAAGLFDAHPNRVLVRFPLVTDNEGVEEINAITERAEREVEDVAIRSVERNRNSDRTPVSLTVAFLSFLTGPADSRQNSA